MEAACGRLARMRMARFLACLLLVFAFAPAWAVPRYPQRVLLSSSELEALVRDMLAEPFRDERLALIERCARMHGFVTDQVAVFVPVLQWREDRLRALMFVAPWLVDRERAARLLALYPDDRTQAAEILGVTP
jgi:Domain of unknown function (DUF4476)